MFDLLDDLHWRGLVAQSTDEFALREALSAGPVTVYCGFDPTAESLHAGNLVPLLALRRFQLAGHRPILLAGGATGLIGDPSGRGTERALSDPEHVGRMADKIREQLGRFFDFSGPARATLVNNLDWTASLSALDFLREIGKHFPVNQMLARDAVASRLAAGGLSFTEFSYQLLQAYDYLHLYRTHDCRLQIGGSDQWGNLTAGLELIRRVTGGRAHALTLPLVTTADGEKFGKSTGGGRIWLDPALTSPYAWFQFWLNTADSEVGRWLRLFTLLERDHIAALDVATIERPAERMAQRHLANELTRLIHGKEQLKRVSAASAALFGQGVLEDTDPVTLEEALRAAGCATPEAGATSIAALFKVSGLSQSLGEARRTIVGGGAYLNNTRVTDPELEVGEEHRVHGRWLVLRRGRHTLAGVDMAKAEMSAR